MTWRLDLYRHPDDEQRAWADLGAQQAATASQRQQMTQDVADKIVGWHKQYPWLSTGATVALARANAPDHVVKHAADVAAKQKTEKKHKSRWSIVGDVVGDVAHVAHTADKAVGHALGAVDRAAGAVVPQPVRAAAKGAVRTGLTAAQAPLESIEGSLRRGVRFGPEIFYSDPRGKDPLEQTTAGQAVKQYAETGHAGLGSGFFPAGEAAKRQAQAARDTAMIAGHAWTPGRWAANAIFEPGSREYNVLSGLVDAGVTWYGDPAARGLKAVGEAGKEAKVLGGLVTETAAARAASKASPEWRQAVDEAVGLVNGTHRPTVVPAAVDQYLYGKEFKEIAERLAETSSPSEIWLAGDKKIPVEVANQLAGITEPGEIAAALRPHLGLDVVPGQFKGFPMRVTQTAQRQLRAFNVMPNTWLPWDDADTFVRNLDNSLANAKVMGEDRRALLDEAFRVLGNPTKGGRERLMNTVSKSVEKSLVGYGVDEKLAKDLTRWSDDQEKLRHFFVDDTGKDVNFNFLLDHDGNPMSYPKPAGLMDMLNSGTFAYSPDKVREIRRLTSRLSPITSNRAFKWPVSMVTAFQQEVWKPAQMLRGAFFSRVNGEEVVRSWASGKFDSVSDWMNFAARGRGGEFDLAKEADRIVTQLADGTIDRAAAQQRLAQINDEIAQGKSAFDEARIGRTAKYLDLETAEKNMVRSGNWNLVRKDYARGDQWVRGISDEIITANSRDPIMRRVANGGLFEGDEVTNARPGLDGIKDWLLSGAGQKFRKRFESAYPGVNFNDEGVLDEVIGVARARVQKLAGDNTDLREVIATGRLNGEKAWTATHEGAAPTDDFLARVEDWRQHPDSPLWQKLEQRAEVHTGARGALDEFADAKNTVMRAFFGNLYGRTSDYLSRSPVFKAEYWKRMESLVPHLDEESRATLLAKAEEAKLGKARMVRLQDAAKLPVGTVDLEAADGLAKGWALDHTHDLLFDASEKSQFFDIGRSAFPFGEAWKEVIGRWARIATENPQTARRLQMIVQSARHADLNNDGQGFFYRDPATGQEMFGYPMPGPLADYLGVQVQGSVQGLSLGTSVIPGLGPVAAVAANKLIPDTPGSDALRSILFAYGEPSSILGSIAPAWAKKAIAAWQGNPDRDRIYANTYMEVVRQLVASGDYGTGPDEKDRLLKDARGRARAITGMRALLQFVVPSAPQIQYLAKTDKGDMVAALLVQDFAKMQADDYDTAVEKFTDKYGDDAMAYMVGKTRSTVGGQKASSAYGDWERENPDIVRKYKDVAGYFGPQDEGFDSTVFQRQEKQGKRVRRAPEDVIDEAEGVLAGWQYRAARDQIGEHPAPNQLEWLRQFKAALIDDYPGWDPDAIPNNLPRKIRTLRQASTDPKIKNSDIGEALSIYFDARDQAIASAKAGGLASPFTAKKAANIRVWLRQGGNQLAKDYPSFARVWDEVLSRELKDDEVTVGG